MRFAVDIAFLDIDSRVTKIISLPRFRLSAPARQAATVIEAQKGAFERWGVRVGDTLEIRTLHEGDPEHQGPS
jgi:uncharacterized membrane protein (UPF0127 family)